MGTGAAATISGRAHAATETGTRTRTGSRTSTRPGTGRRTVQPLCRRDNHDEYHEYYKRHARPERLECHVRQGDRECGGELGWRRGKSGGTSCRGGTRWREGLVALVDCAPHGWEGVFVIWWCGGGAVGSMVGSCIMMRKDMWSMNVLGVGLLSIDTQKSRV